MSDINFLDKVGAVVRSTGGFDQILAELDSVAKGASYGTSGLHEPWKEQLKNDDSLVLIAALHCCNSPSKEEEWNMRNLHQLDYAQVLAFCSATNEPNEEGHPCLLSNEKRAILLKLIPHLQYHSKKETVSTNYSSVISSGFTCPLELICRLHAAGLFHLEEYIALNINNSQAITKFSRNLLHACHLSQAQEEANFTFTVCMCVLVTSLYGRAGYMSLTSKVQRVCHAVVMSMVTKLLKENEENPTMCCTSFLSPLVATPILDLAVLHAFTVEMLSCVLTYNPVIKVVQAIANHHQWTYSRCSPWLCQTFEKVLEVLKTEEVRDVLQKTLQRQDVNWHILLSFVSLYVTRDTKAAAIMTEYIGNLLRLAFESLSVENLVCAFLLARHIAQESPQYFPSYGSWFENYFGFSGTTYASKTKTYAFLMKFLTDLVPFEPAKYLKVHLQKPPHTPAKSRGLFVDYSSLAKTRLQDLNDPTHHCATMNKDERFESIKADIVKVLDAYGSTGKVPRTIIEMSIFKKPYYVQQFLPTFLDCKNFPDHSTTYAKLVSELRRLGKIPGHLLKKFNLT
ncbi:Fanconi anemia group A protein homolog [Ornithodoros turicata]